MMVHIKSSRRLMLVILIIFAICAVYLIDHATNNMYMGTIDKCDGSNVQRVPKDTPSISKKVVIENTGSEDSINYVIFDSSQFTDSLAFLNDKQRGWRVLVINLNNVSQLTTCEVCSLLHDEWINSNVMDKWLSSHSKSDLDPNGLAKMAAYAYALSQGALWIYATDKAVAVPYKVLNRMTLHPNTQVKTGLVYQGPQTVFEPCAHFMDPFTWNGLGPQKHQGRYNVKDLSPHSVYHVVNECVRDGLDASVAKNALDTKAPPPYIMPGTFTAVDFNNILVSNPNAWTLVASIFTRNQDNPLPSPRAVQINLMVQRVLWETDSTVGFLSDTSSAGHQCPTCDLQTRLDNIGNDMMTYLTTWRCEFYETVLACLIRLSEQDFLPDKNLHQVVVAWIALLDSLDWMSGERMVLTNDTLQNRFKGIPVYFTPAKSLHKAPAKNTRPPNPFEGVCAKDNKPYMAKIPNQHVFQDIALVVIFNFGIHLTQIPFVEYIHGRFFKHIVYCCDSLSHFENKFQKHSPSNSVTFVEVQHEAGYWGYGCLAATAKMGYDVAGFLQLSDDVLLNVWNLHKMPYHQPWFQSSVRVANLHNLTVPDVWIKENWWSWNVQSGRDSALKVFHHLQAISSHSTYGHRVSLFLENLRKRTNCNSCFMYETSDIFFVPVNMAANFAFFSDIFFYHKTYLEIAIPTTLAGMISDEVEFNQLHGSYLWYDERETVPSVYREQNHFLHPVKYNKLKDKKHHDFYCNVFLTRLDREVQS